MRKLLAALLIVLAPVTAKAQHIAVVRPADSVERAQDAFEDSVRMALRIASRYLDGVPTPTDTSYTPRFFKMEDSVRAVIAADWDAHASDPNAPERAFCTGWQFGEGWGTEQAYHITSIVPASHVRTEGTANIRYVCPTGPFTANLHVHTPTTCLSNDAYAMICRFGGGDAYECFPSDQDIVQLSAWLVDQDFGAIQCDRNAVVYYKPDPRIRFIALFAYAKVLPLLRERLVAIPAR